MAYHQLENTMNYLFTPPSLDDLIRLLKAWRFWMLGAIFGAMIGAVVYYVAPPPFRAQATVNVDFNLEQAWPYAERTDRQDFYYLDRETRKLKAVVWSDAVMSQLSSEFAIPTKNLHGDKLQLSQPSDGGWHFYADDPDPRRATRLATNWAKAFELYAQLGISDAVELEAQRAALGNNPDNGDIKARIIELEKSSFGINPFIQVGLVQEAGMPVARSIPLSAYLLAGSIGFLTLAVFVVLFIKPKTK